MTTFDGCMTSVTWDGQLVRVRGKNKAARVALAGADHASDVVVGRGEIADVQFKDAGLLTNGRVTIRTHAGRRYILHFRKAQRTPFATLAGELGAFQPKG